MTATPEAPKNDWQKEVIHRGYNREAIRNKYYEKSARLRLGVQVNPEQALDEPKKFGLKTFDELKGAKVEPTVINPRGEKFRGGKGWSMGEILNNYFRDQVGISDKKTLSKEVGITLFYLTKQKDTEGRDINVDYINAGWTVEINDGQITLTDKNGDKKIDGAYLRKPGAGEEEEEEEETVPDPLDPDADERGTATVPPTDPDADERGTATVPPTDPDADERGTATVPPTDPDADERGTATVPGPAQTESDADERGTATLPVTPVPTQSDSDTDERGTATVPTATTGDHDPHIGPVPKAPDVHYGVRYDSKVEAAEAKLTPMAFGSDEWDAYVKEIEEKNPGNLIAIDENTKPDQRDTLLIEMTKKPMAVIDFHAEWCGPCQKIGPLLYEVAEKYKDKIQFAKINIDRSPIIQNEISAKNAGSKKKMQFNIESLPTIAFYANGKEIGRIKGLPGGVVTEGTDASGRPTTILDREKIVQYLDGELRRIYNIK